MAAIDTTTHATLIAKAEKLGIDAEFYDDVEGLKAACREATSTTMISSLAKLKIEEAKMTSGLYKAKELGSSFTDNDFKLADKFLTMEAKFEQKKAEVEMTQAFTKAMLSNAWK